MIRRFFHSKTEKNKLLSDAEPQNEPLERTQQNMALKKNKIKTPHFDHSENVASSPKSASKKVYARSEHVISRKNIPDSALKVLHRLNQLGYEAYLVGGCVRDLLLNQKPKDFDIATSATPEQVQKAFRNCRLVGKRFRLAHILFGREIIEVATFRGNDDSDAKTVSKDGMLLRDNVYGTIEEDAKRRDFTLNSLYYDVRQFLIIDYCNGMQDLEQGIIRLIGDPTTRYQEDPVRMLRAIRFSAKLSMPLAPETEQPIFVLMPLLRQVSNARLFDETLKLLQTGYGARCLPLLIHYHVFSILLPQLKELESGKSQHSKLYKMTQLALENTDKRLENGLKVNPAFLFAALLWHPLTEQAQFIANESGLSYHDAFQIAINDILSEQCKATAIPKRLTSTMIDIWHLQLRFSRLTPRKVEVTFSHPRFRAAYDLLLLRAEFEKESIKEQALWWQQYQETAEEDRAHCFKNVHSVQSQPKRHFKKRNASAQKKQKENHEKV